MRGSNLNKMFASNRHPFFNDKITPSCWDLVLEFLVFDGLSIGPLQEVSKDFYSFITVFLARYKPVLDFKSKWVYTCRPFWLANEVRFRQVMSGIRSEWVVEEGSYELIEWCFLHRLELKHLVFRLVRDGRLDILEKYYPSGCSIRYDATPHACLAAKFGHLEIIKWIHDLPFAQQNLRYRDITITACSFGHFEIVDWIYEKKLYNFKDDWSTKDLRNCHPVLNTIIIAHLKYCMWIVDFVTARQIFQSALKGLNFAVLEFIIPVRTVILQMSDEKIIHTIKSIDRSGVIQKTFKKNNWYVEAETSLKWLFE